MHGGFSSGSINAGLLQSLAEDRLGPVYGPVLPDDEESIAKSQSTTRTR